MFSRRSLCAFAVAAAFAMVPARFAAAQDHAPRIGTVNPARVFNDMAETKDLKQKMESDAKQIQATGKQLNDEMETAKQKRGMFNTGTPEAAAANQDFIKKAMNFQLWQELTKQELARQQKDQMKNLFEKIEAATKEVADAKKLDLVLVEQKVDFPADMDQMTVDQVRGLINQRTMLFVKPELDITKDVTTAVDAKYKNRK